MERIDHGDDRIVHFHFEKQYDLIADFIRLQEFYESPLKGIRGELFTLDEFMDAYAEANGNFTYFTDWLGFNVPGNIVIKFRDVFYGDMRPREWGLLSSIDHKNKFIYRRDPQFYVIGTCKNFKYVNHELAHAYYYLAPAYKDAQDAVTASMDPEMKAKVAVKLVEMGYTEDVIDDEIQAYFSTDEAVIVASRFGLEVDDVRDLRERYNSNFLAILPKKKALA